MDAFDGLPDTSDPKLWVAIAVVAGMSFCCCSGGLGIILVAANNGDSSGASKPRVRSAPSNGSGRGGGSTGSARTDRYARQFRENLNS